MALSVPTFSTATRDYRWRLARKFLQEEHIDALFVYGEHEDSGAAPFAFDAWFTNARPGTSIVFPRSGAPVQLMGFPPGAMDYVEAHHRGEEEAWIPPENVRLGRGPDAVAGALEELGLANGTIGVIGLEPSLPWHTDGVIPYPLWSGVLTLLPHATFKPVFSSFVRGILPLNDEEVAVVKHAASIGSAMAEAMVGAARPGASESDVFAAGMFAAHSRGSASPWMHITTSPEPINWGAPKWSYKPMAPKIIENGDTICSEIFSFFGQMNAQLQLVITVGDVHKEINEAANIARQSYEIALRELRPGVAFGDVCEAMIKPVREAGGWSRGPGIHSLNPLYALSGFTSDLRQIEGTSRYPYTVATLPTILGDMILKPGMTFALEPGCGFGPHTVTIGSTVVIGEDGPIELNPYTAQIHTV